MNSLKKYLTSENRRIFKNYFRLSSYYSHPELKIKGIPNERFKMLLTMRDLRLWIEENAPFSSRAAKYKSEIYQINTELNYIQFRAYVVSFGLYLAFFIFFMFWGPQYWRGAISTQSRPALLGETGGYSVVHDGAVPKLTTMDLSEMFGI